MFKRLLSLMLVLAMLFSFTACANDNSNSEDTTSSTAIVTSSEESEDTSSESSSASSSESTEIEEEKEEGTESQGGTGTQSSFSITKQPQNTSVTAGKTLTLSLTASGTGLSYQWYTSLSPSGENAVKLDGQTETSIAIYTEDAFVQYYYCVVSKTGTTAQIKSNIVTASANSTAPPSDVPTITNQPIKASYPLRQSASPLSVTANIPSGNGTLSYQWFEGSPASGTEISGETSSTYTPSTTTQGSKTYYCVVTNTLTDGTTHKVTSSGATIEVVNTYYNIWIKGIQVTDENSLNILEDSSASVQFDRTTNTLTLNGADISYDGSGYPSYTIRSSLTDDLIINLIGENKITNTGSDSSIGDGYDAISVKNDLTIKGNGSLTATGGNDDDVSSGDVSIGGFGIRASSALEISGFANVTAIGGASGLGIRVEGAAKISENAIVIATGGDGYDGDGIYANSTLEISGEATVIATGGDSNGENGYGGSGIFIYSKLEILDEARVSARGGNSLNGLTGHGINMDSVYSEFNIGTSSVPFAGMLVAVAGTGGNPATAFNYDAATNFGDGMNYYTYDGATWAEGGLASSLPANHKNNIGLYFGTSAPT